MTIEMDARQEREYKFLVSQPVKPVYEGECASCHCRIPAGYLPVVTRWRTDHYGQIAVQKPVTMYCRKCGRQTEDFVHHYRRPRQAAVEMQPKYMAVKILELVSVKPQSSRKLARRAGAEYGPVFKAVVKALLAARKIGRDEETGRYMKKLIDTGK